MLMICSMSITSATSFNRREYKGELFETTGGYLIGTEDLPSPITKHLKKNYRDYTIVIAKRKNNGHYFVKIQYDGGNGYRRHYRSFVFNSGGKAIKG